MQVDQEGYQQLRVPKTLPFSDVSNQLSNRPQYMKAPVNSQRKQSLYMQSLHERSSAYLNLKDNNQKDSFRITKNRSKMNN